MEKRDFVKTFIFIDTPVWVPRAYLHREESDVGLGVRACACTCVHVCTCVRVLGLLGNGRMGLIQGCQSALGIPVCKVSDGPSSAGTLRPQHTLSAGSPHLLLSTFLMWLLDRGKLLV